MATFHHDDEVSGAKFTADEKAILSWSKDKTARLWDVNRPDRPLVTFPHDGAVTGAVLSADETRLLTSGDDYTARLWDAKSGRLIHKLVYEPRDSLDASMKTTVTDAAFCDNDLHISFRCYDGTYFWDAASGKQVATFDRIFTGDKPRFITQTRGVVGFHDEPEGKAVRTFHHGLDIGHELDVTVAAFNSDRTRFLTLLDRLRFRPHALRMGAALGIGRRKAAADVPSRRFRERSRICEALGTHSHVQSGWNSPAVGRSAGSRARTIRHGAV